jgi:hypothetical protein
MVEGVAWTLSCTLSKRGFRARQHHGALRGRERGAWLVAWWSARQHHGMHSDSLARRLCAGSIGRDRYRSGPSSTACAPAAPAPAPAPARARARVSAPVLARGLVRLARTQALVPAQAQAQVPAAGRPARLRRGCPRRRCRSRKVARRIPKAARRTDCRRPPLAALRAPRRKDCLHRARPAPPVAARLAGRRTGCRRRVRVLAGRQTGWRPGRRRDSKGRHRPARRRRDFLGPTARRQTGFQRPVRVLRVSLAVAAVVAALEVACCLLHSLAHRILASRSIRPRLPGRSRLRAAVPWAAVLRQHTGVSELWRAGWGTGVGRTFCEEWHR